MSWVDKWPDDHVHEGWPEIASVCRCSIRKAQQLTYQPEDGVIPLPVDDHKGAGKVLVHAAYRMWCKVTTEPARLALQRRRGRRENAA